MAAQRVEVLATAGGGDKVVAKQRGAYWNLYILTPTGKSTPINKYGAKRQQGHYFAVDASNLASAAYNFGYYLADSPLTWRIRPDHDGTVYEAPHRDAPDKITHPEARVAYRKRLWDDADSVEQTRSYWANKRGVCARTHDEEVLVWRNEDGTESLVRERDVDVTEFAGRTERNGLGWSTRIEGRELPLTENVSYLPLDGPDCIVCLPDGVEVECETIKQLVATIQTGTPVESAKQIKTRERKARWEAWKQERNFSEEVSA